MPQGPSSICVSVQLHLRPIRAADQLVATLLRQIATSGSTQHVIVFLIEFSDSVMLLTIYNVIKIDRKRQNIATILTISNNEITRYTTESHVR